MTCHAIRIDNHGFVIQYGWISNEMSYIYRKLLEFFFWFSFDNIEKHPSILNSQMIHI